MYAIELRNAKQEQQLVILVSLLGAYSRQYNYRLSTTINPIYRYIDIYLVAERYSIPTSYLYKQLPRVDLAETP